MLPLENSLVLPQRHKSRLERREAARRESAAKLAGASAQAVQVPGLEDEDNDLLAALEDLQRKEQDLKAMDEPMWTGTPPWKVPSKWHTVSGMQVYTRAHASTL